MSKVVKNEFGNIEVVSSNEKNEFKRSKRKFYAVKVKFANGSFADIAYFETKKDALEHIKTVKKEIADALGITKIGVVELELITRSE